MKKLIGVIGLVALLMPARARGEEVVMFTGLQASGTYGCGVDATGTMLPCDLNGFRTASFQATCTAGPCVAEVKLWQKNTTGDQYSVVLDLFPATANDMGYSNSGYGLVYAEIIWTSGTFRATLVRNK